LSYDTPYTRQAGTDVVDDVHTPELLNIIVASGLPNHKLLESRSISNVVKKYKSEFRIVQRN